MNLPFEDELNAFSPSRDVQMAAASASSPRDDPVAHMKRLTKLVALVPVITKTDAASNPRQLSWLREELRFILRENGVKVFNGWLPAVHDYFHYYGKSVGASGRYGPGDPGTVTPPPEAIPEENEEDLMSTLMSTLKGKTVGGGSSSKEGAKNASSMSTDKYYTEKNPQYAHQSPMAVGLNGQLKKVPVPTGTKVAPYRLMRPLPTESGDSISMSFFLHLLPRLFPHLFPRLSCIFFDLLMFSRCDVGR